jgi:hypothetical protein
MKRNTVWVAISLTATLMVALYSGNIARLENHSFASQDS